MCLHGTEKVLTVEDQLELVLVNHFDDGDPTMTSAGENLFTYFRLIADYDLAAQFEFEGQAGGLLKNSEPVHVVGNFLGATAYRYEYRCENAMGETMFVYDVHVPRICAGANHVEKSDALFPYDYTRQEIVDRTPGNVRNILVTRQANALADQPPLLLKFVNTSFDPDGPDGGVDGGDPMGDEAGALGDAAGACAFHPSANRGGSKFNWAAALLIPLFLLPRVFISRADKRVISNE